MRYGTYNIRHTVFYAVNNINDKNAEKTYLYRPIYLPTYRYFFLYYEDFHLRQSENIETFLINDF